MYLSTFDYEVLARQKREAMLAEAKQRHALVRQAKTTDAPKRSVFRAFVALFQGRIGTAEQPTVGTRAA